MTRLGHAGSEVDEKGAGTAFLGGALAIGSFSVLTFGNASEWFEYVTGVVLIALAGMLAYKGIHSILQGRRFADKQSHDEESHDEQ